MKDVLKTLNEKSEEVKGQYEKLAQQAQQTQAQLSNIAKEMARLEGEARRIDQLKTEFAEESESKSEEE